MAEPSLAYTPTTGVDNTSSAYISGTDIVFPINASLYTGTYASYSNVVMYRVVSGNTGSVVDGNNSCAAPQNGTPAGTIRSALGNWTSYADGIYYEEIQDDNGCANTVGPTVQYFRIRVTSGVATLAPPVSGLSLNSPIASYYTHNPIEFSGTYDNTNTYNQIQFSLVYASSTSIVFAPIDLNLVNGSGIPFSTKRNLPFQGGYVVKARLTDTVNATSTAWTSPISFGLGATTTASSTLISDALQTVCTPTILLGVPIPDFGCEIKNGIAWLFYPDQQTLDQFKSLTLADKLPFSYAYDMGNVRNELFNTSQTASSTISYNVPHFGTITFLSRSMIEAIPYTSTIKTILGWLLWFMLANLFYYQILRANDKTPQA